jgi:hypothetical protein
MRGACHAKALRGPGPIVEAKGGQPMIRRKGEIYLISSATGRTTSRCQPTRCAA